MSSRPFRFDPEALFLVEPDQASLARNRALNGFRTFVHLLWIGPPLIGVLLIGVPFVIRLVWRAVDEIPFLKKEA